MVWNYVVLRTTALIYTDQNKTYLCFNPSIGCALLLMFFKIIIKILNSKLKCSFLIFFEFDLKLI